MIEKCIKEGICHSICNIYRYAKANNKYMNDYGVNIRYRLWSLILRCKQFIWSGNVPKVSSGSNLIHFKLIKDTSQFNSDLIKNDNEESDEGYFPEVYVQYLELHFYLKEWRLEKPKSL